MDDLLKLIESGELEDIISDEKLLAKLNELVRYEFLIIDGDTIKLSEKGKKAIQIGVEESVRQHKTQLFTQKRLLQNNIFKFEAPTRHLWVVYLIICISFFIIFLLIPTITKN